MAEILRGIKCFAASDTPQYKPLKSRYHPCDFCTSVENGC